MSLFDKIFGKKQKNQPQEIKNPVEDISPDTHFVEQFKDKGGKFLYCTSQEEVLGYLHNIFEENSWEKVLCFDKDRIKDLNIINIPIKKTAPVFYTTCEHLIVEDGGLLFSSNQLKEAKLNQYPNNFIVYATTSQLVHDKDKALASIKHSFKNKIPSNISAIKDYSPDKKDPNFLHYGNTNSKNLYLILLENL